MTTAIATPHMDRKQLKQIKVPENRARPLRESRVKTLAASIEKLGLLQPIGITPRNELIFGLHRLEACRLLGAETIKVLIFDSDARQARLAEIDENLEREELTALERADLTADKKALYEAEHPAAKHGGIRKVSGKASGSTLPLEPAPPAFADVEAEHRGETARSVRADVQISESIEPEVKEAIADTPIADSKRQLTELAQADPDEQRKIAKQVKAGAKSVKEAKAKASKKGPDTQAAKHGQAWKGIRSALRGFATRLREAGLMDAAAPYELHPDRIEAMMRGAHEAGSLGDVAVTTSAYRSLAEACDALYRIGKTLGKEFAAEIAEKAAAKVKSKDRKKGVPRARKAWKGAR